MARIIPDYNVTTRKTVPSWIDTKAIIEAGKGDLKKIGSLTKQATQSGKIVASYFCAPCNKVFQASHSDFIKQATLARKSNKECELLCPKCGHKVTPYKEVMEVKKVSNLQTLNTEKRVDLLDKTASSKGTYNTFVDRKIMYEAIEKLARYASKAGMTACVARYVKGEHIKEAGSDLSTINNIECTLEWMFGRKQKGRATAKVKVDQAGKFEFPRVFKVASGMEYPFEEKYIRRLEREPAMFQSMPTRKKSDVPVYRKPDPTRFRVVGSMKPKVYKTNQRNISLVKDVKASLNITGSNKFKKFKNLLQMKYSLPPDILQNMNSLIDIVSQLGSAEGIPEEDILEVANELIPGVLTKYYNIDDDYSEESFYNKVDNLLKTSSETVGSMKVGEYVSNRKQAAGKKHRSIYYNNEEYYVNWYGINYELINVNTGNRLEFTTNNRLLGFLIRKFGIPKDEAVSVVLDAESRFRDHVRKLPGQPEW